MSSTRRSLLTFPSPFCDYLYTMGKFDWRQIMPGLSPWNLAPDICPETRLLLGCARTCIDFEKSGQIKACIQENVSWMRLIKIAFHHRMMPLLYGTLSSTCPEYVPQTVLELLHDHFRISAQRNQLLAGELVTILALFKMHDISVMSFKGPVLATFLYRNPAYRECGDLDLLIRKRDVPRAKNLLIAHGYHLPPRDATDRQQAFIFKYKHSYNLFSKVTQVNVDLHWRFTSRAIPFGLDLDSLWKCLDPMSFAGTTVLSPPPDILLVLLCVHGAKHFNPWERLIWICDVAKLIEIYQQMNWERALGHADQLGSKRMLFVGILLASALMEVSPPGEILQMAATDRIARILATQIGKRIFAENRHATRYDRKAIPNLLFHLRMRERLRDRLSTFLQLTHRKLSFDVTYRKSLKTLPLQAYLPLLSYTLLPGFDGLGSQFQE
ncbi:MAG: nucleotidyltransferase family protein [Dehalococcoidia bacterium]|nr:nucleotidyltransferase family protein [Dehalococcoidia bacterium]